MHHSSIVLKVCDLSKLADQCLYIKSEDHLGSDGLLEDDPFSEK